MHECPSWLTNLKGSSIQQAIEVIGIECKPQDVIVIGCPFWEVFDFLVGIPTVDTVKVSTNYKNPSTVITGWRDTGDVFQYPITRPSRAFNLNPKISWINPMWEGWSHTCDLVVLAHEYFPFDSGTSDCIGDFVHRMAPDTFISIGKWPHDFPPKDFFTVELNHAHCGFHPVHVENKRQFNTTTRRDHAGARIDPNRDWSR
jgi:hypothetical protein